MPNRRGAVQRYLSGLRRMPDRRGAVQRYLSGFRRMPDRSGAVQRYQILVEVPQFSHPNVWTRF
ncbi:hypothetical protein [Cohnella rhizosphaerae]|uniref:Uncharacterized protein n=1 Tax=Cohnella rhizosphaerae TaxID=1457232 RepID=A0A9X4KY18_9BACL|nr:hypothetical protein [Cohnella rhizosphaerae]MDG0810429.1 hypothetical protein [Cohnella rhizosphaerae]